MSPKEKREAGVCYDCKEPSEPNRARCAFHLARAAQGVARYLKTEKGQRTRERLKPYFNQYRRSHRRGVGRYEYVSSAARRRGLRWDLSEGTYQSLIGRPCHYCGLESDVEAGVGLDRIDNTMGYTLGNVVPCCSICNLVRADRFTVDEMAVVGRAIREVRMSRPKGFNISSFGGQKPLSEYLSTASEHRNSERELLRTRQEQVRELRQQGLGAPRIGKTIGLSTTRVQQIIATLPQEKAS